MIDRLQDLLSFQESPLPYTPPTHSQFSYPPGYNIILSAQSRIQKVKKSTSSIKELKGLYSKTASIEEEQKLKQRLRNLVNFNNSELNKIREITEELGASVESGNFDDTALRMLKISQATLLKHFTETVAESEKAQNDFFEYSKAKISGQLRMVDSEIDEETIEQCLERPELAQSIFSKELMGGHTDVLKMVHSIEDRLEDIKMLEKNIMIMHQMFLDLAGLVEGQGEILNSIEAHLDSALDYVKSGVQQIQAAEVQLKAARSKKCCVLVILLVVGTIIAMPIIAVKYS